MRLRPPGSLAGSAIAARRSRSLARKSQAATGPRPVGPSSTNQNRTPNTRLLAWTNAASSTLSARASRRCAASCSMMTAAAALARSVSPAVSAAMYSSSSSSMSRGPSEKTSTSAANITQVNGGSHRSSAIAASPIGSTRSSRPAMEPPAWTAAPMRRDASAQPAVIAADPSGIAQMQRVRERALETAAPARPQSASCQHLARQPARPPPRPSARGGASRSRGRDPSCGPARCRCARRRRPPPVTDTPAARRRSAPPAPDTADRHRARHPYLPARCRSRNRCRPRARTSSRRPRARRAG